MLSISLPQANCCTYSLALLRDTWTISQEALGGLGCSVSLADQAKVVPSLVPRPFLYGWGANGEGRKGLVNNSTPTWIHGCIPAISVD